MRRRGFTLIEIMVVVAIIALLMALTIPIVGRIGGTARISTTKARISDVCRAIELYKSAFGLYPRDYIEGFSFVAGDSGNKAAQEKRKSTAVLMLALTHSHIDEPGTGADCPCKNGGPYYDQLKFGENVSLLQNTEIITTSLPKPYRYSFLTFASLGEDPKAGRPAVLLMDPWGNPLVYDEKLSYSNFRDGKPKNDNTYDITDAVGIVFEVAGAWPADPAYKLPYLLYSLGPNGEDDTHQKSESGVISHGDDLGNW